MRTITLTVTALFLCGFADVALAGDHTLASNASAVDWKYDVTSPVPTLSAKSRDVAADASNIDVQVGSHALSPVRSAVAPDRDVINLAATGSVLVQSNASLSHSLSPVPLSSESSRILKAD